nr:MAG: virion morphogenesis family protein [Bacteriophage sp.]
MPSKSVNITLSIPVGPLEIYVDKREQARAERLIAKTPSILTKGYEKGTEKFGNQLLRIVRRSLNTGVPPRGSEVSWPPHAPGIIKKYGDHTMLHLTGQYARSVTLVKGKKRTFVGLPIGIKKITYTGKTSRKTLNQIAIMLEYGSRDGNLPPRPLWNPAFKAAGGKAALQKEIRNEVRKEIRKVKNGSRL